MSIEPESCRPVEGLQLATGLTLTRSSLGCPTSCVRDIRIEARAWAASSKQDGHSDPRRARRRVFLNP